MIGFETNYTEKFINITPDNQNFNYQLVNQYGPWVATVDIKADVDLIIATPKMAEYMMDRAKFLYEKETAIQEEIANGNHDAVLADMVIGNELQKILKILKDAGVEVVEK